MRQKPTFFRDRNGAIVIAQFPNWPLLAVIAVSLLQLLGNELLNTYLPWVNRVLLLYWSYLEIRFGVNGFRKVLGLCVGGYTIVGIIQTLATL